MKMWIFAACVCLAAWNLGSCDDAGLKYIKLGNDVVYTVEGVDNHSSCSDDQSREWSYAFHNCFMSRKYQDGGRNLEKIVDRILDHSKDCIDNSTKPCRPGYKGFTIIIGKVIEQMQDYSRLYLDDIKHGREKIKDLDCVEESLSATEYQNCFKPVFKIYSTEGNFEEKVENAISCTNKANKKCSRMAKTTLNRMVRDILKVKQPEKEDIVEEVKPTEAPPKRWYEYIIQPFVSLWNTFKSWFGF